MATPEAPDLGRDDAARTADLGAATIDPTDPVVAGSYGTWRLTYTAGPAGLPTGSRLRLSTDSDTDGGVPQTANPAGDDYLTLEAPADVGVALAIRDNKEVTLTVYGRGLRAGEQLTTSTFGATASPCGATVTSAWPTSRTRTRTYPTCSICTATTAAPMSPSRRTSAAATPTSSTMSLPWSRP